MQSMASPSGEEGGGGQFGLLYKVSIDPVK